MTFPTRIFRAPVGVIVLLVCALPLLSGCDEGSLNAPDIQDGPQSKSALFDSYVALGNSITAGFQSGGINQQTQSESYAVLLADSVLGTPFGIPALNNPGCPAPFESFFDNQGIPDPQRPANAQPCAFRSPSAATVRNVAVPSAKAIDVLQNDGPASPNQLTQFILGGRTQIDAALEANPTFASIWVGNNDVLTTARNGETDVTPVSDFQSQYTQILDRLESSDDFEGGALIGVANPTFIPLFSPGPVYFALDQAGQFPPTFDVDSNCDTINSNGLSPLVPLEYGFRLLGEAAAGASRTLDCDPPSPNGVLTLNEVSTLVQTVNQYNAFLETQADQRNLAYLDPNPAFQTLYADQNGTPQDPTDDPIPKFPDRDSDEPFGQFFSLDGFHPNAKTHRLVTNELAKAIENEYGINLSGLENAPQLP